MASSALADSPGCASPVEALLGGCPSQPPAGSPEPAPSPQAGSSQAATAPALPAAPGPGKSGLVAPGRRVLSDAAAARHVRRTAWEPRRANRRANRRVPTRRQLRAFRRANGMPREVKARITGHFRGTTDEIIQWASWKWGLNEDLVRAEAVTESWWDQRGRPGDGGISFGLMQIKRTACRGTYPLSSLSTAFNLDYYGATIRYYYDGRARWMRRLGGRAARYRAGDLWGSVGAWFSGNWYSERAEWYTAQVAARLTERTWEQPGF